METLKFDSRKRLTWSRMHKTRFRTSLKEASKSDHVRHGLISVFVVCTLLLRECDASPRLMRHIKELCPKADDKFERPSQRSVRNNKENSNNVRDMTS